MKKALNLVVGAPASGKTTFARRLATRRKAALFDIDECTETLVRAALTAMGESPDDRDSPVFKTTFRDPIYQSLMDMARGNLGHVDVVVCGPFTKEMRNPNWLQDVQAQIGLPCSVRAYFVYCDSEVRRSRMLARGNPRDASKLADWSAHEAYYLGSPSPLYPHVAVDTASEESIERSLRVD
ncbi:AAA family ATPase [Pelagicoccus sp. SDUM812003]|nr:AAA family ATPase [Pelagicoccus sp. SDUM812003]